MEISTYPAYLGKYVVQVTLCRTALSDGRVRFADISGVNPPVIDLHAGFHKRQKHCFRRISTLPTAGKSRVRYFVFSGELYAVTLPRDAVHDGVSAVGVGVRFPFQFIYLWGDVSPLFSCCFLSFIFNPSFL